MVQLLSFISITAAFLSSVSSGERPPMPRELARVNVNSGCVYSYKWSNGPGKLCDGSFKRIPKGGNIEIYGCIRSTPDGKSEAGCKISTYVDETYYQVYYGHNNNLYTEGGKNAKLIATHQPLSPPAKINEKIY